MADIAASPSDPAKPGTPAAAAPKVLQRGGHESVLPADRRAGRRTHTQLDDVFTRTVGRLPPMWAFGLAVAVYVVFGALVPVALRTGRTETIILGSFGASWSLVVILSALLAAQTATHRRLLIEWTSDLRKLDSSEFEWLVAEVLRREGWAVHETGRRDGPDGGVDLRAKRGDDNLVVQCKRWQAAVVGVDEVRKIAGVATDREHTRGAAALVTLSNFSEQAIVEARRLGVELIDGRALLDRIEHVRDSQPCSRCGTPMIVDRSPRGWWLRCPAHPRCSGKRDLASDPGAAVAFLTK